MDCARTIKKLGAEEVKVIYRRAREQMPAEDKEIEEAIRTLFRVIGRTKALVRLYHSSSRKSAICRCLTPSILSCHRSSILTTYLG